MFSCLLCIGKGGPGESLCSRITDGSSLNQTFSIQIKPSWFKSTLPSSNQTLLVQIKPYFKSNLSDSNQTFSIQIKPSWLKSNLPLLNETFLVQIKSFSFKSKLPRSNQNFLNSSNLTSLGQIKPFQL